MIIATMCQYVQLTENVTDGLIVKLLKVSVGFAFIFDENTFFRALDQATSCPNAQ